MPFSKYRIILIMACVFLVQVFSFAQNPNNVSIGILSDVSEEATGPLLQELKNEINAVLGSGVAVTYKPLLVSGSDLSLAASNYQQRVNDDTDIIITFGAPNAIVVYQEKQHPKPVIAFGSINKDLLPLKEGQTTSQINNVNYIITPHSYTRDLQVFESLFQYKNIGIIIDDFTANTLPVNDLFTQYFGKKNIQYKIISLSKSGILDVSLDGLDAVYIAGGFGLSDSQYGEIISQINTKKLPSFSGVQRRDVERGILATQQPEGNTKQFFRRVALNVESIVSGKNASQLPMFLDYKEKLSLNFNTATQIDFPLRYSLLATTDMIGNASESLSDINYSIVDIMAGVVDKNLSLNVSEKNIELAQQDVKTAKSGYLPNVTANANGVYVDPKVAEISGGANPEISTSANITLQQLIYSNEASAGIDIQESVLKAQEENYNASQLDALLDASVAYFNALILKTNVTIQNQNLQLTKRNLEISEQNFEAGASGKADVLRFRSQLAQNTQALIEADINVKQAYYSINQLMNMPIATTIGIEDAEIEKGIFQNYSYGEFLEILDNPRLRPNLIDFLIDEANKNAPEIKSLDYNLEATQRNYKFNNVGRYIPTVSLQGQYNLALSQSGAGSTIPTGVPAAPDGTYNLGLNVSLPIFQQNQRNINRQTAKIQEDQLGLQKESIVLSLERNVNDLVLDLISQIANIEISKVSEETAKESLELVQDQYQNGAIPVIQLIDAQSNYLQAQLSKATANYNYLLTSMQLERVIGNFFLMNSETANQEFMQRANQFILSRQ